jgi:hypothetical protein
MRANTTDKGTPTKHTHFNLLSISIILGSSLLYTKVSADDSYDIGSGNPGLKVIARSSDPNAVVIYHELPETPFGGFVGVFMTNENIHVIVDRGYGFQKADMLSLTAGVPLELYPFGSNSAFTDEIGAMEIMKPPVWLQGPPGIGYMLISNNLTIFTNVQQLARAKYHLNNDEIFLGFLDNKIFFCKNGSGPTKVFWREQGSPGEYYYRMPKAVRDVFGVTKAFAPDKDVGFVVLRPTQLVWPPWDNWFLPPYHDDFIEISLLKGKLVQNTKQ